MKRLIQDILGLFAVYAERALAARGEFGPQETVQGFTANSAYDTLGATKYVIMAAVSARGAVLATDPGSSTILGVLQNAPARGEAATIAYAGHSKIVAGATVSVNAIFTTDASGRATTVRSGDIAVGRLLEAGAAGQVVSALLFPPFRWFGAP